VLCAVQAATVLLPRRKHARGRARARFGWLGVAAPAAALATGIVVLRVFAGGPHALALLAAVATPALAAARTPLTAGALWLAAWLANGLAAQAASVALIALAAVMIAELAAAIAPEWSLVVGLVVLAVVDVVLVWGTAQVQPATTALHGATVGHGIPELQDATFGGATMGWFDLVAPALLGVVVAHGRLRAAVVTGLAAGAWGLLLLATPTIPATVPVLAGLLAGRTGR